MSIIQLPSQTVSLASDAQPQLRILFVAPYMPSRIRVRTYHLLRGLAARGHAITLICPVQAGEHGDELEELHRMCERVYPIDNRRITTVWRYARALLGDTPLQASHSLSNKFVQAVQHEIRQRQYDVIHVEHLRAAEIVRHATRVPEVLAPAVVFDSVDCISLLFERALRHSPAWKTRAMALSDLARTKQYESRYGTMFQHIVVTSPEDQWALQALTDVEASQYKAPIDVIPNGVDLEYFSPRTSKREQATLLFTGKMSYHANHAAARFLLDEIMPLVWNVQPDVRVQIVGAAPGKQLLHYTKDLRVTITGYVPDLRPYLANATRAVCPLRYGVGIQNKVLEAMAMQTPVIASRQSTIALAVVPGQDLLVAEGAAQFAEQIVALLADSNKRLSIGAHGRRYVEHAHSWQASLERLEQCYRAAQLATVL